jgi:hypothetical protein
MLVLAVGEAAERQGLKVPGAPEEIVVMMQVVGMEEEARG